MSMKPRPRRTDEPQSVVGSRFIATACGRWVEVSPEDFGRLSSMSWSLAGKKGEQYPVSWKGGRLVKMHRLIVDAPRVDHADRNPMNCRRDNLRSCSDSQNSRNRKKRTGSHQYKGVQYRRGRYIARINHEGTSVRQVGSYDTAVDAAECYDEAARHYFGEFACVNFPKAGERGCL